MKLIRRFAKFFSEAALASFCDEINIKYLAIEKIKIISWFQLGARKLKFVWFVIVKSLSWIYPVNDNNCIEWDELQSLLSQQLGAMAQPVEHLYCFQGIILLWFVDIKPFR